MLLRGRSQVSPDFTLAQLEEVNAEVPKDRRLSATQDPPKAEYDAQTGWGTANRGYGAICIRSLRVDLCSQ